MTEEQEKIIDKTLVKISQSVIATSIALELHDEIRDTPAYNGNLKRTSNLFLTQAKREQKLYFNKVQKIDGEQVDEVFNTQYDLIKLTAKLSFQQTSDVLELVQDYLKQTTNG